MTTPSWVKDAEPDIAHQLDELRDLEVYHQGQLTMVQKKVRVVEQLAALLDELPRLELDGVPWAIGRLGQAAWSAEDEGFAAVTSASALSDETGDTSAFVPPLQRINERASRQRKILELLGQEPRRWWKAREIADPLCSGNVKSMRATLGQMADRGLLIKTADARYRYNDGEEQWEIGQGELG